MIRPPSRRWLLPMAVMLPAASPPQPRTLKIGPQDYPEAALAAGAEGDVELALVIGQQGRVIDCTVTAGADLPGGLGKASCDLARRHFRFEPARDDAGRVMASAAVIRIAWRIALKCPPDDGHTLCAFV